MAERTVTVIRVVVVAAFVIILAYVPTRSAEMYCVPFELGADYQEMNGWSYDHSTHDERTTRIDHWTNVTGETMRTVYVANMPDPETGRHFNAMCQTR